MALEDMCNQTFTVKACTLAAGAMGGEARTYATRSGLVDVPASIQAQRGSLVETFQRRGIAISHAVYSGTDLSASELGDRVTADDGRVFLVRQVIDMGAQGRGWAMYVDEIPPTS